MSGFSRRPAGSLPGEMWVTEVEVGSLASFSFPEQVTELALYAEGVFQRDIGQPPSGVTVHPPKVYAWGVVA